MNKAVVALGLATGVVLIVVIAKKAAASGGGPLIIGANQTVTLLYNGPTQTVQAALGAAVNYIIDFSIWSDTAGWVESTDPAHDILPKGSKCQVQTTGQVTLYNFTLA
jgi:hypothetical protein